LLLFTSCLTSKAPYSFSQKETYCGEEAQLWYPVPNRPKLHGMGTTPFTEWSVVP